MTRIAEIKERLAPYPEYPKSDSYALIVPDHASGKRYRYTVYRIPLSPSLDVKVIGRELPLKDARRIARTATKNNQSGWVVRYQITEYHDTEFQSGPYGTWDLAMEHLADIKGYEGVHGAHLEYIDNGKIRGK